MKLSSSLRTALITVLTENAARHAAKPDAAPESALDAMGLNADQRKMAVNIHAGSNAGGVAFVCALSPAATAKTYDEVRSYISSLVQKKTTARLDFPTLSVIRVIAAPVSMLDLSHLLPGGLTILTHNLKDFVLTVQGKADEYVVDARDKLELVSDPVVIAEMVDALTPRQIETIRHHSYFSSVVDRALAD